MPLVGKESFPVGNTRHHEKAATRVPGSVPQAPQVAFRIAFSPTPRLAGGRVACRCRRIVNHARIIYWAARLHLLSCAAEPSGVKQAAAYGGLHAGYMSSPGFSVTRRTHEPSDFIT